MRLSYLRTRDLFDVFIQHEESYPNNQILEIGESLEQQSTSG